MQSKNKIKFFITVLLLHLFFGSSSCTSNDELKETTENPVKPNPTEPTLKNLQCTPQIEQSDYSIYVEMKSHKLRSQFIKSDSEVGVRA